MHISQTCIIHVVQLPTKLQFGVVFKLQHVFQAIAQTLPHNVMSICLVVEEEIEVYIPVHYQVLSPHSFPCRRCATSTGPLVIPRGCRSMGSSMSLSSRLHSRMASYSACSVSLTPKWGIDHLAYSCTTDLLGLSVLSHWKREQGINSVYVIKLQLYQLWLKMHCPCVNFTSLPLSSLQPLLHFILWIR